MINRYWENPIMMDSAMMDLKTPDNDSEVKRHSFYTAASIFINTLHKDLKGLGTRTREFEEEFGVIRDSVKADDIRNKTIIAVAIFVWTVAGGGITLYVQKTIGAFDAAQARVELLEKKVIGLELDNKQLKDTSEKVEAVRRILNDHSRQLDEIEAIKRGKG